MQTYVDLQDTEEIHEIEVQVSLGQCVFCSRQKTVLREIRVMGIIEYSKNCKKDSHMADVLYYKTALCKSFCAATKIRVK